MAEVIKGNDFYHTIVVDGDVKIDNKLKQEKKVKPSISDIPEESEEEEKDSETDEEQETEEGIIKITQKELDDIRAQYRMDGQQYEAETRIKCNMELAKAREEAENIITEAKGESAKLLSEIEEKTQKSVEDGRAQGYNMGYRDGQQKGEEDGYVQGLKKCRETLLDLKKLCEDIEKERNELMAENRRAIFDMSMEIAQKITMTMLSQKDKSALQRMISAAAKQFRNAKHIKVTLSRLDLSEDVEADFKLFEKCFSPTSQVEFEVLEGAEKGTLMLETESEILDAGVSTQLKMIEELGSGKYRDKEVEKEPDGDVDNIKDNVKDTAKETVKETPKKPVRRSQKESAKEASAEPALTESVTEAETADVSSVDSEVQAADVSQGGTEELPVVNEETAGIYAAAEDVIQLDDAVTAEAADIAETAESNSDKTVKSENVSVDTEN